MMLTTAIAVEMRVRSLGLFGSVARGKARVDCEVDLSARILLKTKPGCHPIESDGIGKWTLCGLTIWCPVKPVDVISLTTGAERRY